MRYMGLIDRYRDLLPVTEKTPLLTLHEGNTPLVRADRLSELLELDLYFKYEGMNPTGSFKDRGMEAYRTIASSEGIFAEPASAASIAGIMKLRREGKLSAGHTVVCVLTGHGLKDPNIAIKTVAAEPIVVQDTEEAVMGAIHQLEASHVYV